MWIERESLGRAMSVLEEDGSVVIQARPRAGLTLFLSQVGNALRNRQAAIHYINAAIKGFNLMEQLGELLMVEAKTSVYGVLNALKAQENAAIIIDGAESLTAQDCQVLEALLQVFSSERLFTPQLSHIYIVVGTRAAWEGARLHLDYFSRTEVATLLKRKASDNVTQAVYAWSKGSPDVVRDLASSLRSTQCTAASVCQVVREAAQNGSLYQVARNRPSIEKLRSLGLVRARKPIPAISLALKLVAKQTTGLIIHRSSMEAWYQGNLLPLLPQEMRILCHLAAHPGRIFSPTQIYAAITGDTGLYLCEGSIKVQISRLRNKLPSGQEWVLTRRGLGYLFNPHALLEFLE